MQGGGISDLRASKIIPSAGRRDKDDGINRFAIDLLWVRVGGVGGSESYIRNLLDGMRKTDMTFSVVLLVSEDNEYSFKHYEQDARFQLAVCPVRSKRVWQRIAWQNLHQGRYLRKLGIKKCFEPVYCMPLVGNRGIDYYTVIHDIQARHYPQYFTLKERLFLNVSWRNAVLKSQRIIAISNYTRKDIIKTYHVDPKRVEMIYNPVSAPLSAVSSEALIKKYGVEKDEFFFCVSSLLPHKNLDVLLDVMKDDRLKRYKLLIAGIGGKQKGYLIKRMREDRINNIAILPFIDNAIRDALYHNCQIFLFPSIFEGFGMPPVEALLADKPVITTTCTSIPEVTKGEAIYVKDPYSVKEWLENIIKLLEGVEGHKEESKCISSLSNPYLDRRVAERYLALIEQDAS